MSNPPFQPIQRDEMRRDVAVRIESILADLAKDCGELTAESARGKIEGVQEGLEKARDLQNALKSLNQTLRAE